MRRCLITGCGGFIGSHLAERLLAEGWSVCGTVRRRPSSLDRLDGRLTIVECDVLDSVSLEQAVATARPEVVFHLAAQSSPSASWLQPELTFRVNVFGTLYLLQAMLAVCPNATLVAVTSSAIYGASGHARCADQRAQRAAALQPLRRKQSGGGHARRALLADLRP